MLRLVVCRYRERARAQSAHGAGSATQLHPPSGQHHGTRGDTCPLWCHLLWPPHTGHILDPQWHPDTAWLKGPQGEELCSNSGKYDNNNGCFYCASPLKLKMPCKEHHVEGVGWQTERFRFRTSVGVFRSWHSQMNTSSVEVDCAVTLILLKWGLLMSLWSLGWCQSQPCMQHCLSYLKTLGITDTLICLCLADRDPRQHDNTDHLQRSARRHWSHHLPGQEPGRHRWVLCRTLCPA